MDVKRLKQLRREAGLTQQELSDRLSISRSAYAQYEVNRRVPEYSTLIRLADFFEVSLDYLTGRDHCPTAPVMDTDHLPPEARREIEEHTEYIRYKYNTRH